MTDRELLERAAKAAGREFENLLSHGKWNPLVDDGECARLEAALMLHVEWHPMKATVYVGTAEIGCTKPWGTDRQKARRHAAVRAAAELAK